MTSVWFTYSESDEAEFTELMTVIEPMLGDVDFGVLSSTESSGYPNKLSKAKLLVIFSSGNWLRDQVVSDALLIALGAKIPVFWVEDWSSKPNNPKQKMLSLLNWRSRAEFRFSLTRPFLTEQTGKVSPAIVQLTSEIARRGVATKARDIEDAEKVTQYRNTDRYVEDLPYLGLYKYTETDELIFFGRDDEINSVLSAVERGIDNLGRDTLFIHGSSGSGKSSFMRAGVIPSLKRYPSKFTVLKSFDPTKAVEINESLLDGEHGFIDNLNTVLRENGIEQIPYPGANWGTQDWEGYVDTVINRISQFGASVSGDNQLWRRTGRSRVFNGTFLVIPIDQAESLVFEYEPLPDRRPTSSKLEREKNFLARLFEELVTGGLPVFFVITITDAAIRQVQQAYFKRANIEKFFLEEVQDRNAILDIIMRPSAFARPDASQQQGGELPSFPEELAERIATEFLESGGTTGLPLLSSLLRKLFESREEYKQKELVPDLVKIYEEIGGIQSVVGHLLDEIRSELKERFPNDFDLEERPGGGIANAGVVINRPRRVEYAGNKELFKKGRAKNERDDVDFVVLSILRSFAKFEIEYRKLELRDFVPTTALEPQFAFLLQLFYEKRITVESQVYSDVRVQLGSGSRLYRLSHRAVLDHISSTSADAKKLTNHLSTLAQIEGLAKQFAEDKMQRHDAEPLLTKAQFTEFTESIDKYGLFDRQDVHAGDIDDLIQAYAAQQQSEVSKNSQLKRRLNQVRGIAAVLVCALIGSLYFLYHQFSLQRAQIDTEVRALESQVNLAALPLAFEEVDRQLSDFRNQDLNDVLEYNLQVAKAAVSWLKGKNLQKSEQVLATIEELVDNQIDEYKKATSKKSRLFELDSPQFHEAPLSNIVTLDNGFALLENGRQLVEFDLPTPGNGRDVLRFDTPIEEFILSKRNGFFVAPQMFSDLLFIDLEAVPTTGINEVKIDEVAPLEVSASGFHARSLLLSKQERRFAVIHAQKHFEVFEVQDDRTVKSVYASAERRNRPQGLPASSISVATFGSEGKHIAVSYDAAAQFRTFSQPFVAVEEADGSWTEFFELDSADATITHLTLSEQNEELFGFSSSGSICVWRYRRDSRCEPAVGNTRSPIETLKRLSPNLGNGAFFVTGHQDGTVQLWEFGDRVPKSSVRIAPFGPVLDIQFDPLTDTLSMIPADGSVVTIGLSDGDEGYAFESSPRLRLLTNPELFAEKISLSSDGEMVVVAREVSQPGLRKLVTFEESDGQFSVPNELTIRDFCRPDDQASIRSNSNFRADLLLNAIEKSFCARLQ